MSGARILIVDDDPTVADVVARYLRRDGNEVAYAGDGPAALAHAAATPPDLVLLDLMLPGMSGLEVCRRLRDAGPVAVVMLTALGEETDRVIGLETGADDYVTKPFSPRELALRVQAVLRRTRGQRPVADPVTLRDGPLVVDTRAHEARLDGELLALTAREFDLLAFLMRHPRRAFSRKELLGRVWGWSFGDLSTVTVHVRRLRAKVEDDPPPDSVRGYPQRARRIVTVWGVGYRYEPQVDDDPVS